MPDPIIITSQSAVSSSRTDRAKRSSRRSSARSRSRCAATAAPARPDSSALTACNLEGTRASRAERLLGALDQVVGATWNTRLAIGSALIEVTAEPHTGCKKFVERFGMDAMTFVNTPEGKQLCLRGINTRVVESGTIRVGDIVTKR